MLDEVRIWNVARSAAEILRTMRQPLSGQEPGLVAYWRFDEGVGTVAYDATPNHLGGALNGAPRWEPVSSALTCRPWNGTNGGVLAFLAHSVTMGFNGIISAAGKGYRGGPDYAQANVDGYQGESFTGSWPGHSIAASFGGGGGGGRNYTYYGNGGGGGGFGGTGANGAITTGNPSGDTGQMPARGGSSYGTNNFARLLMGSGGGSGGQDGDNMPQDGQTNGGTGGAGGGIVICFASALTNPGFISASGQEGSSLVAQGNTQERGTGGGGAGGSVWLGAPAIGGEGRLNANSGEGGYVKIGSVVYAGGAGGVGRIRLDLASSAVVPATVSPAPGWRAQLSASNAVTAPLWAGYTDSDNDGLGDGQEYLRGTPPNNPDTDGDGLPDGWEVQYGLNPTNRFDAGTVVPGDQLTYLQKFGSGLNPLTPTPMATA